MNAELEIIEHDTKNLFTKINSCGLTGINAYHLEIEVNISGGLPAFILVGLPDASINESRERIKTAINASGLNFPNRKIVVNLAPANAKKGGPTYDLAIAAGILANFEQSVINNKNLEDLFIVGELGLSGKVRPVNGVLSFVIFAKKLGAKGIIIPLENAGEASLIEGIKIFPVKSLIETIETINDLTNKSPLQKQINYSKVDSFNIDFSDVKGQLMGKRAMEISASGGHHLLMTGSPGSGKSMLAQRLITILPPLTYEEKIEATQIYSAAGKLNSEQGLIIHRPFRSPHSSISIAGLIGGSSTPQPGEISLAHKGVLFLDELTEFQKNILDSLRQSIETKSITISRSKRTSTFPCDFTLIAACNPCPCGYYGDQLKKCVCSPNNIKRYQTKISGPILDRIDLQIEIKRLNEAELTENKISESSLKIKKRVEEARERQLKRYKNLNLRLNSELSGKNLASFCKADHKCSILLKEAIKNLALSARGYDRLLKVSRTIADLENSDIIKDEHILEALQFRMNTLLK